MKRDNIRTRKYWCTFKLHGYHKANNTWIFNVICVVHDYGLGHKLRGHPIVCNLNTSIQKKKKLVSHMTLNMVQPKNILSILKRKKPKSVLSIRQMYSVNIWNNKAIWGQNFEMQPFLKLLDDGHYVSMYKVCEDGKKLRYFLVLSRFHVVVQHISHCIDNWFNI